MQEKIDTFGPDHSVVIALEPSRRKNLDFDGALVIVTVERHPFTYEIAADLKNQLKICPHCLSNDLLLHGRYVVRIADLPYVNESGRVMPVQYAISAQRYQCSKCNRGTVEQMPEQLKPVITRSRITKRLSQWLMHEVMTNTPYETLARMTGYSKIWVRKWFEETRQGTDLQRKPSRPGPKTQRK